MEKKSMLEEKIILEQAVTRANVLLGSELYNEEAELKQLVDNFKEDEKEGKISVTELNLYADDFEYWMGQLYNNKRLPKEANKYSVLNEFRSRLESDLKDFNGSAYEIDSEELDFIVDLAVGQCSAVLDKLVKSKATH